MMELGKGEEGGDSFAIPHSRRGGQPTSSHLGSPLSAPSPQDGTEGVVGEVTHAIRALREGTQGTHWEQPAHHLQECSSDLQSIRDDIRVR